MILCCRQTASRGARYKNGNVSLETEGLTEAAEVSDTITAAAAAAAAAMTMNVISLTVPSHSDECLPIVKDEAS